MARDDGASPWDQLPGEIEKAHSAFQVYMTIDPGIRMTPKGVVQACREYCAHRSPPLMANETRIKQWIVMRKIYHWGIRSSAHDAYMKVKFDGEVGSLIAVGAEQWAKRKESVREMSFTSSSEAQTVAMILLQKAKEIAAIPITEEVIEADPETGVPRIVIKPHKGIKPSDAVQYAKAAMFMIEHSDKVMRLSADMETTRNLMLFGDVDFKNVSDADLQRIEDKEDIETVLLDHKDSFDKNNKNTDGIKRQSTVVNA